MSRALQIGSVALAAATVLSACSSGSNATGSSPTPSAAATSSTPSASSGEVPKVPAPLPVDALTANPCAGALSSTQLNELAMAAPGRSNQTVGGTGCVWAGTVNTTNSVYITPITANNGGLSDIYANNGKGNYAYFEPTTADGYPGVYAEPSDGRSEGFCTLVLGVTDQLTVSIEVHLLTGANKANPCNSANKVGTALIEHLKGAA
jgi:hypothetical protein